MCPGTSNDPGLLVVKDIGLVPPPAEHFEALRQIPKLRARAHDLLTTRERQIVLVLSEGLSNKGIARRLRLTEGTVKVHLHNIYQKLGISNRTALAATVWRGLP
jgi:two-component system nitrate/nitrite response regulator NarL